MLIKDFQIWDVFENTNGHLSMIYRDDGANGWSIMNYNGSFYRVSKNSKRDYNFVGDTQKDASDFIRNFPQDKFNDYSDKVRYWEVHDAFFHQGFKSFPKRGNRESIFPVGAIQARLNHLLLLLLN